MAGSATDKQSKTTWWCVQLLRNENNEKNPLMYFSSSPQLQINTQIKLYTNTHTHIYRVGLTHLLCTPLRWRAHRSSTASCGGRLSNDHEHPGVTGSHTLSLSLSLSLSPLLSLSSPSLAVFSLQQQLLIFALMLWAKIHHKVTRVFESSFLKKGLKNSALLTEWNSVFSFKTRGRMT